MHIKQVGDYLKDIAKKAKSTRLKMRLTQKGLSKRSGVSLGSIKRFEYTGKISLDSLLKIATVLDACDGFDNLFKPKTNVSYNSLDEVLADKNSKNIKEFKRGTIK